MYQRIRFLVLLICLSAFLLLGFASGVSEATVSTPSLSAGVSEWLGAGSQTPQVTTLATGGSWQTVVHEDFGMDGCRVPLIYGPFDLSDAVDAKVDFRFLFETGQADDFLSLEVSTDGSHFESIQSWNGSSQTGSEPHDWVTASASLRDFTKYRHLAGASQVWVAWRFHSDNSGTSRGPWLDDISILKLTPGWVTVTGRVLYSNRNDDMREVWSVRISLYDWNTYSLDPPEVFLASTYTDDAGVFTFDPVYNYDSWDYTDPDTRLDLFIVVEAYARESGVSYSAVTYFNGLHYKWNEPCGGCSWGPWWNVPDGTITLDYSIGSNDLNRVAMWLLRDAQRSWDYVDQNGYSDPGFVVIAWQKDQDCFPGGMPIVHVCNPFFWGGQFGPFIFIPHGVRYSRDTVIHEIGHNYMYNVTQSHYWYPNDSCWWHDIWVAKEERCGWSEGWADFFPLLVNGDRCYDKGPGPCTGTRDHDYFDLENQGWSDAQPRGPAVEGRVAGALYDLYDSNNEGPFDIATNSFASMWIIMRDRVPAAQTLADFGNSWKNSG